MVIELKAADQSDYVAREDIRALLHAEFIKFDRDYDKMREPLGDELDKLSSQLDGFQKAGQGMWCSDQIRNEAEWLLKYRADWPRLTSKIAELRASLDRHDQGDMLQEEDGSWGGCTEERYRKLEPTVDEMQSSRLDPSTLKPLSFISDLTDPLVLQDYLWRLQVSDIAATGKNNRDELGAVQTAFAQLIYKDELRALLDPPRPGFWIDDAIENVFGDFMQQTQHPRTGYWGPWYRVGNRLLMVQDLSYTFHHVNFRAGNVGNWNRIADTTLKIRGLTYPNGWKPKDAAYSDHHNYDVVQIFFRGWPYMTRQLKTEARSAMEDMLHWCLTESVKDDGFGTDDPFESLYFGVRFLDRIGYWDSAKRFWSRQPLRTPEGRPTPAELAVRLDSGLKKLGVRSERGETIANILRFAVCAGAVA